ncbi:MltA domain-containing protein [Tumidithrix helvetica PCC 7403]|uniref:murein transglycosylase A n=1 Tax=Tumidithrix helvetica TaxID=3457545 RepID=UPI003CA9C672
MYNGQIFSLSLGILLAGLPSLATTQVPLQDSKQENKQENLGIPKLAQVLVPLPKQAINPLSDRLVDDLFDCDRAQLLKAIDYSIQYIRTPKAADRYPVGEISRDRMERSLIRFRQLVQTSPNAVELQKAVLQEFDLHKSIGLDRKGTVQFTGYYEAVYKASRTRNGEFQYPIYRLPPDFSNWERPHPTREMLEGSKRLAGSEIAWLSDRFQAFLIHVQGSARLVLNDGSLITVGFAGKTDRPYTSVGAAIVRDGKMRLEDVTLQSLMAYFQKHPQELVGYLNRNQSFVFFRETNGSPAIGSLNVPVTAERSIATDKSIMPAGAIALIRTPLPFLNPVTNTYEFRPVNRFVLDQDTGGAIKGAGRVDIFMGTGEVPKQRAGLIKYDGELYYLVLKK